jgi:hypothetical protein
MDSIENTIETCTHCDVPINLHGTSCGWKNATWVMYPTNQEQNEWSRKWIDAHPGSYPLFRNNDFVQNG